MVGGRPLFTDSTHIKANANNGRYEKREVTCTPYEYLQELEQAVNEDRVAFGKKPLPPKEEAETKEQKVSLTDPDSGNLNRDGKPEGFHYLDHRTVDHKYNVITDCYVTPGNVKLNIMAVIPEVQNLQSENGKAVYALRAQTIERSFADAKVLHGLRYCRFHQVPLFPIKMCCIDIYFVKNRGFPTA